MSIQHTIADPPRTIPAPPDSAPTIRILVDPQDPTGRGLRAITFAPTEETAAQAIQSLLNNTNLRAIAYEHGITVEALTSWMAQPETAQRIFHLKRGLATQHSLAATSNLKHAVSALTIILQEYTDAACHEAGIQAGRGASPSEHIRRDRETARKACTLLARLANFDQSIRMQSPRGHAGATGAARTTTPATPPQRPEDDHSLLAEIKALLTQDRANATPAPALSIAQETSTNPVSSEPPAPPHPPHPSHPSHESSRSSESSSSSSEFAPQPPPTPNTAPASQAEGLNVPSRGVERGPASDTPGTSTAQPPHPEGMPIFPAPTLRPIPADFLERVHACNCDRYHRCKGCPPEVISARFDLKQAERTHRARDPTRERYI